MCRANGDSSAQQSAGGHGQQEGIEEQVREVTAEESDFSVTESESEIDGEEGVWGCSRVNSEAYKRIMVV